MLPTVGETSSPTPLLTTLAPTTNVTEPRIDVIRLPDYKSHDTVDGVFIGIFSFILLIMLVLCLQKINLDRRRLINRGD
jgi:hypothetical protein